MKKNFLVVIGAVWVIFSVLPFLGGSASYKIDMNQMMPLWNPDFNGYPVLITQSIPAIIIIFTMSREWKWRGYLWITLTAICAIFYLGSIYSFYQKGQSLFQTAVLVYSKDVVTGFSFRLDTGFYAMISGYIFIVAASIWDILQQKKQQVQNQHTTM